MTETDEKRIRMAVRDRYGRLAQQGQGSCCGPEAPVQGGCCGPPQGAKATTDGNGAGPLGPVPEGSTGWAREMAGYTEEQMENLPEEASSVSAGCGNPTAIAELEEGQTVLDLGSGGGIDVFLSAERVGPEGRAIGVDATPEMVWRARETAQREGLTNVEFRLGEMERLPVESGSVDVIISNCVINLSPDKDRVFSEAFRVLRPGGRLTVSDIVTQGPLPESVARSLEQWSGCVAGALDVDDYVQKLERAGFTDVEVRDKYVYSREDGEAILASVPEEDRQALSGEGAALAESIGRIASATIVALKPA